MTAAPSGNKGISDPTLIKNLMARGLTCREIAEKIGNPRGTMTVRGWSTGRKMSIVAHSKLVELLESLS